MLWSCSIKPCREETNADKTDLAEHALDTEAVEPRIPAQTSIARENVFGSRNTVESLFRRGRPV
jgi:hypothetical protein